jgi:hypothetical protein
VFDVEAECVLADVLAGSWATLVEEYDVMVGDMFRDTSFAPGRTLGTEKDSGSGEKLEANLPGLVGMFDAGKEGAMLVPATMTTRLALGIICVQLLTCPLVHGQFPHASDSKKSNCSQ